MYPTGTPSEMVFAHCYELFGGNCIKNKRMSNKMALAFLHCLSASDDSKASEELLFFLNQN